MERCVFVNGKMWYQYGRSLWHEFDDSGKPTGHRGRRPGAREEFCANLLS